MAEAIAEYQKVIAARRACYRIANRCGLHKRPQCPHSAELVGYAGSWYFLTDTGLFHKRFNHRPKLVTNNRKKLTRLRAVFTEGSRVEGLTDEELSRITAITSHTIGNREQGIFYQKTTGSEELATLAQSQLALLKDLQRYLAQRQGPDTPLTPAQQQRVQRLAPRLGFFVAIRLAHSLSAKTNPEEVGLLWEWSELDCLPEDLRKQLKNLADIIYARPTQLDKSQISQDIEQEWRKKWVDDEKDRLDRVMGPEMKNFWAKTKGNRDDLNVIKKEIRRFITYTTLREIPWIGRIIGFVWSWFDGAEKRRERVAYWHAVRYVESIGNAEITQDEYAKQEQRLQAHSRHLGIRSSLKLWYEEQLTMFPIISQYALPRLAASKKEGNPVADIQLVCEQLDGLSQVADNSIQSYWDSWLEGQEIPAKIPLSATARARILAQQRYIIGDSLQQWGPQLDNQHAATLKEKEDAVRKCESRLILIATFEKTLQTVVTQLREYAVQVRALANDALPTQEAIEHEYVAKKELLNQQVAAAHLPEEETVWLNLQFGRLIDAFKQQLQAGCAAKRNEIGHDVAVIPADNNEDVYILNHDNDNQDNIQNNLNNARDDDSSLDFSPMMDNQIIRHDAAQAGKKEEQEAPDKDNNAVLSDAIIKSRAVDARIEQIQQAAATAFAECKEQVEKTESADNVHLIFNAAKEGYEDCQQQLRDSGAEPYFVEQLLQLLKSQWASVEYRYQSRLAQFTENVPLASHEIQNEPLEIEDITIESLRAEETYQEMYVRRRLFQVEAALYAHFAEVGLSLRQGAQKYIAAVIQHEKNNRGNPGQWQVDVEAESAIRDLQATLNKAYKKARQKLHPQGGRHYRATLQQFEFIKDEQARKEIQKETIDKCLKIIEDANDFWKQVLALWVKSSPRKYGEVRAGEVHHFYEMPRNKRLTLEALGEENKRLSCEMMRGDALLVQHNNEITSSNKSIKEYEEFLERMKGYRQEKVRALKGEQAALKLAEQERLEKEQERREKEREREEKEAALKLVEKERLEKEEIKAKYEALKAQQPAPHLPEAGNANIETDVAKLLPLDQKPPYPGFFSSAADSIQAENQAFVEKLPYQETVDHEHFKEPESIPKPRRPNSYLL